MLCRVCGSPERGFSAAVGTIDRDERGQIDWLRLIPRRAVLCAPL
jgi:hypothetical protein